MRAPDSNDDFARRRRTGRLLSRIHVLSLAALVLSVVPGMPGLILAGRVAFQDQLGSFDRGLALGCLAALCVAGLVGSVVASKRLRKLGTTQLTDACRSIALSGTLDTGFHGTWSERRVRLSYTNSPKAAPYLDLEIQTALDLSLLLRQESVAHAVRGSLTEWLGPTGYLRLERDKLRMRSIAPDLLELSADRAVALRADMTKLIVMLESIAHAAPDEQEPAAKEPKVNSTRIVGAGLASTVFGIHSAVAMGALVISMAAVPAAFAGSTLYPTLDFFPRVIWSCVFAIPLAATSIAIWRRFRPGAPAWFHLVVGGLAALGVPIVAYALVVWCNGTLDSSDPRSHEATLVQKHTRSEGRGAPSMWFEVSSWREPRKSERIRVNTGMFESWNRGDAVTVTTRKGALRMEYWTWIAPRADFERR